MSSQLPVRVESIPQKAMHDPGHFPVSSTTYRTFERRIADAATGATAPCRVIALSPITISGSQTVDTVALLNGDRLLRAGETDHKQNGIFVVNIATTWLRSDDTLDPATTDAILVTAGSATNAGSFHRCTHTSKPVFGTSNITFARAYADVYDASITDAKIGNRTPDPATSHGSLTGTLLQLLSLLFKRIWAMLGTTTVLDAVPTTLVAANAHYGVVATSSTIGHVKPDEVGISVDGSGTIFLLPGFRGGARLGVSMPTGGVVVPPGGVIYAAPDHASFGSVSTQVEIYMERSGTVRNLLVMTGGTLPADFPCTVKGQYNHGNSSLGIAIQNGDPHYHADVANSDGYGFLDIFSYKIENNSLTTSVRILQISSEFY